jgi:3,4-dihydroxy-2-butanone 4-phosphate synthase
MIIEAERAFQFDTIDDVVSDVARGRIVIVTDDADRENEGDLVMAAEKVTPDAVNFMAKHGRGLICAPISNERAEQLGLQRMVAQNRECHGFYRIGRCGSRQNNGNQRAHRATTIQQLQILNHRLMISSNRDVFHYGPKMACCAPGIPSAVDLRAWLGL